VLRKQRKKINPGSQLDEIIDLYGKKMDLKLPFETAEVLIFFQSTDRHTSYRKVYEGV